MGYGVEDSNPFVPTVEWLNSRCENCSHTRGIHAVAGKCLAYDFEGKPGYCGCNNLVLEGKEFVNEEAVQRVNMLNTLYTKPSDWVEANRMAVKALRDRALLDRTLLDSASLNMSTPKEVPSLKKTNPLLDGLDIKYAGGNGSNGNNKGGKKMAVDTDLLKKEAEIAFWMTAAEGSVTIFRETVVKYAEQQFGKSGAQEAEKFLDGDIGKALISLAAGGLIGVIPNAPMKAQKLGSYMRINGMTHIGKKVTHTFVDPVMRYIENLSDEAEFDPIEQRGLVEGKQPVNFKITDKDVINVQAVKKDVREFMGKKEEEAVGVAAGRQEL